MLAKLISKNQITLPKKVIEHFGHVQYFEVTETRDEIILKPLRVGQAELVREKLSKLGIASENVKAAVKWARK